MLTDIEIAQQCTLKPITEIAESIGLSADDIDMYGKYKAKVPLEVIDRLKDNKDGKLILVTAINPTPAGEGKTTTSVGLGMAMNRLGMKTILALREPSLGPVMGIKGGAAGGGYSQVLPMEDINLHFTGDMHAITAANNLLSAAIDNHLHHGNALGIDPRRITWKRCMDMNDRALRNVIVGLGGKANSYPREDGFNITVASEIMAILCLSNSISDLNNRIGDIIIGYNYSNQPVYARDLQVDGAMTMLLKDALCPNLVQTIEGTPAFVHGGPFANIAHGCNSILATKTALKLADYVVTEAGFGADLGAEKFFDIKCRYGNLKPCAVVLVATIRALKYNGGVAKDALKEKNVEALKAGICNLDAHVENLKKFGVKPIVAFNHFDTDHEDEIAYLLSHCEEIGVPVSFSDVFAKGGEGGLDLAEKLAAMIDNDASDQGFHVLYDTELSIKDKIKTLATEIYGAGSVNYSAGANKTIQEIEALGKGNLPICVAKTQYSFSDNPKLLGRPTGFELNVSEIRLMSGARFIVVLTGNVMTMPGLPKEPAANRMTVDEDGTISGLF